VTDLLGRGDWVPAGSAINRKAYEMGDTLCYHGSMRWQTNETTESLLQVLMLLKTNLLIMDARVCYC
jgi:hypothetical protein